MSDWTYKGKIVTSDDIKSYFGFVYEITDTTNNKKYIGRKYIYSRRKMKGSKRRTSTEADWQNYWGSSKVLQKEVEVKGKEKFTREILVLCKGQGETNFAEVHAQFLLGVLESDDYINDNINGKWYKKNVMKYDALKELRSLYLDRGILSKS